MSEGTKVTGDNRQSIPTPEPDALTQLQKAALKAMPVAPSRFRLVFPPAKYNAIVEETVKAIHQLSTVKGGEYAGDADRLANFRRNAEALGVPMTTIWAVYAAKHFDAIMQYAKDLQNAQTRPRSESITGRADDLIVYLILFKAIVSEIEDCALGQITAGEIGLRHVLQEGLHINSGQKERKDHIKTGYPCSNCNTLSTFCADGCKWRKD